jgi:hypothetical protein
VKWISNQKDRRFWQSLIDGSLLASHSCQNASTLSPSIALKRKFLAVELTVSLVHLDKKSRDFRRLAVPETIEWE